MLSYAVKFFRSDGFDIWVDPSWLLIATPIIWGLADYYLPVAHPDQSRPIYFIMAMVIALGFMVSLLIHEWGHRIAAHRFKVTPAATTLSVFGGVAQTNDNIPKSRKEFWVAAAGPLTSLLLAAFLWALGRFAGAVRAPEAVIHVLGYLAVINAAVALFNLLPAPPTDGGRMLLVYLWHRDGDFAEASATAARFVMALTYLLIALGLLAWVFGLLMAGLWSITIGLFFLIAGRGEVRQQWRPWPFKGKTVATVMSRNNVIASPDLTLSELVNQIMLSHGISFVPVVENGVLLGQVDQTILQGIERENWGNTRVGDVFVGLESDMYVRPDTTLIDLLNHIQRTKRRKLLVTDGRQLLGVITLSDLLTSTGLAQSVLGTEPLATNDGR